MGCIVRRIETHELFFLTFPFSTELAYLCRRELIYGRSEPGIYRPLTYDLFQRLLCIDMFLQFSTLFQGWDGYSNELYINVNMLIYVAMGKHWILESVSQRESYSSIVFRLPHVILLWRVYIWLCLKLFRLCALVYLLTWTFRDSVFERNPPFVTCSVQHMAKGRTLPRDLTFC